MFTLPISARTVELRLPTGAEELFLIESPAGDSETAAQLLNQIVGYPLGDEPRAGLLEWPVTDFEWLLLQLRRMLFGGSIRTDARCPAPGCGARIEVQFDMDGYLEDSFPSSVPGLMRDEEDGWFVSAEGSRFRAPLLADQIASSATRDPESDLVRRCVKSSNLSAQEVERIGFALEQIAPALSRELEGVCPDCGRTVPMFFDVVDFVLTELRGQARYVLEDVDRLAARYHWTEAAILSMPSIRRARYSEMCTNAERAL